MNNIENCNIKCRIYLNRQCTRERIIRLDKLFKSIKILDMKGCEHTKENGRWMLNDENHYLWDSILINTHCIYNDRFLSKLRYNRISDIPQHELQGCDIIEKFDENDNKYFVLRKTNDIIHLLVVLPEPMSYKEIREKYNEIKNDYVYNLNVFDDEITRLTRSHLIENIELYEDK